MSWIIYHKGTGTMFSANDDVVAINVNDLSQDEVADLEDGANTEAIANTHGMPISDDLFDKAVSTGGDY